MDPSTKLEALRKWRNGKIKIFFFCIVGSLVGYAGYTYPYPSKGLVFQLPPPVVKYVCLIIAIAYAGGVLFFAICLFTNIWERNCDRWIAQVENEIE